jgi:protein-disulfide isomerase
LQEPTLVEEFVKTGKVQIIYEHFPGLGRESVWAAGASFCAADQNKFWEYHNLLFHVQAKAGQLEDEEVNVGRFDLPKLKEFGKQVGIPDQGTFEQCIDSGKHDEDVANQQRRARSLGITGTPGFLINGRPLTTGALANIEDWREVLNDAVNQAQNPSPSPTAAGVTVTSSTPAPAVTPTPTRAP